MRRETANKAGYTLVELMITVAIVAILASIAYPSYSDYVRRSHRNDASGEVLAMAQRMEKIRAQTFSYAAGSAITKSLKFYDIRVVLDADTDTYTITAVPLEDTDQVNDRCGTLTYASDGTWSVSTNIPLDECMLFP